MLPPKRKRFYTAKEVVRARDDLALFCDIYHVFVIFLIDSFVLNSNPMSASPLPIFFFSVYFYVNSPFWGNLTVFIPRPRSRGGG